jgi:hypothetical protein
MTARDMASVADPDDSHRGPERPRINQRTARPRTVGARTPRGWHAIGPGDDSTAPPRSPAVLASSP